MSSITEPVHEIITFSHQEKQLLNSPLVQRLQWVGQLTGTKQVFPGGTHSRFIHSAGAMYLAGEYMETIFSKFNESVEQVFGKSPKYFIQVARIAALLHDIGHGPFSHSFDRTVYKPMYGVPDNGHDTHRFMLIESDLLKPYIEACGVSSADIAKVWKSTRDHLKTPHEAVYHIIHCVIQGPLGADRLDFTKRDGYFTGSKQFGTIAEKRIILVSSISKVLIDDITCYALCYHKKSISNIERTLDGRRYMYNNVYYHQKSMASSLIIERMMDECTKDLNLIERVNDPEQFRYINDYTLIGEIMALPDTTNEEIDGANGTKEEHISKTLCKRFLDRKLPTLVKEILHVPLDCTLENDDTLPGDAIMVMTKPLMGINPEKFDEWGIYFVDDHGNAECLRKILNERHFTTQAPYQIARWYVY